MKIVRWNKKVMGRFKTLVEETSIFLPIWRNDGSECEIHFMIDDVHEILLHLNRCDAIGLSQSLLRFLSDTPDASMAYGKPSLTNKGANMKKVKKSSAAKAKKPAAKKLAKKKPVAKKKPATKTKVAKKKAPAKKAKATVKIIKKSPASVAVVNIADIESIQVRKLPKPKAKKKPIAAKKKTKKPAKKKTKKVTAAQNLPLAAAPTPK